jgi:hypothetical protein
MRKLVAVLFCAVGLLPTPFEAAGAEAATADAATEGSWG